MLREVFYWVFNMSITALVTGVFVLLIRSIKGIPKRITVFLWLIPFLRMVIPVGLGSRYSLMTLISAFTTKTVIVYHPTEDITLSMTNSIMAAEEYFPLTYKSVGLELVFGIAAVIWIIVALTIILMLGVTYFISLYEIRDSVHLKENIYISQKVISPAVYGVIKPKIILPLAYNDKAFELVILHEKMHIRRLDNLWRVIALLVTAIHWFNPFSWIFLKLCFEDLELALDEKILAKIGKKRAKEYALLLLQNRGRGSVFASSFGGAKIRTRIENILSFKKMTWFSLVVFTVLFGAIFYFLLTNAG